MDLTIRVDPPQAKFAQFSVSQIEQVEMAASPCSLPTIPVQHP